jgi:hypothetical protein
MNVYEAFEIALASSHMILKALLEDMEDPELMIRPVEEANHPAWQIGHLICSEFEVMEAIRPGISPRLPAGFLEVYGKFNSRSDDPTQFHSKREFLELYDQQRNATLEILRSLSENELDAPGPEKMRSYAPTIGAAIMMHASHELMHAGQFTVLRRKLGKPVVF